MTPKKILVIYGTRPEIIKLFPVINLLKINPRFETKVINTGQHAQMTRKLEELFNIQPDYFLNIMVEDQSLNHTLSKVLEQIDPIYTKEKPDLIIVQGDTATVLGSSIAAYNRKIDIAHIEAGLRSFDLNQPFPEEFNRKTVSLIAKFNFCPTVKALNNLKVEGVEKEKLFLTGNTVVDAAQKMIEKFDLRKGKGRKRKILITAHRRENHANGIESICRAVLEVKDKLPEVEFVWPVHPNPNVKQAVYRFLEHLENVHLVEPLPYQELIREMYESYLIWTDSGGMQEEAPSFKKPVLILRNVTERPEVVESGFGKLVGTDIQEIVSSTLELFTSEELYTHMISGKNPFGEGDAAEKIIRILEEDYQNEI